MIIQEPVEVTDEKIEEVEVVTKKRKRRLMLIMLLLLLLIFMLFMSYRLGNIGYNLMLFSEVDSITLSDKQTYVEKQARINVFGAQEALKSEVIDGYRIIYPSIKGSYKFCIKNESNTNLMYNLRFANEMTSFINMKYRLKIDNIYIRGNDGEYVDLSKLNVENIMVPKKSNNIYTLEWYWESDNLKDQEVLNKQERQYYTIKMEVSATTY